MLKLDWDFPKAHLWTHVNYSTRPNEKMHGTLKDAYSDQSNGKDIEKQVNYGISRLHNDHLN